MPIRLARALEQFAPALAAAALLALLLAALLPPAAFAGGSAARFAASEYEVFGPGASATWHAEQGGGEIGGRRTASVPGSSDFGRKLKSGLLSSTTS